MHAQSCGPSCRTASRQQQTGRLGGHQRQSAPISGDQWQSAARTPRLVCPRLLRPQMPGRRPRTIERLPMRAEWGGGHAIARYSACILECGAEPRLPLVLCDDLCLAPNGVVHHLQRPSEVKRSQSEALPRMKSCIIRRSPRQPSAALGSPQRPSAAIYQSGDGSGDGRGSRARVAGRGACVTC